MLASLGFLINGLEIAIGDGQVFVVVQIDRNSLFVSDPYCGPLELVSVPLFE